MMLMRMMMPGYRIEQLVVVRHDAVVSERPSAAIMSEHAAAARMMAVPMMMMIMLVAGVHG